MKYCILFLLVFIQGKIAKSSNESKLNSKRPIKHDAIYIFKFYYEEEPNKVIFTKAYSRSVNKDGSFCLVDYDPADITKVTFSSCFDSNGIPTQFGDVNDITKISKDSIKLNFKGKDTVFRINAEKQLKDPTTLWFWKHMPKLNESVTVGGIRKNFTTKSIDLVNISYTYEGKDNINVLGKMKTCYKVKSIPLNGSTGIYDERWFDQDGMLVKEKHVVGKDGTRVCVLTQILGR